MLLTSFIRAATPSEKRHYFAVIELSGNGLTFEVRDSESAHASTNKDDSELRRKVQMRNSEEIKKTGFLSSDTVDQIIEILRRERNSLNGLLADGHGVTVKCLGTAPLRAAQNGKFVEMLIRSEIGLEFEAIDGDQEARYAALGLLAYYPNISGLVVDMGGGSTELALIEDGRILKSCSVPIGTSSITKPKDVTCALKELDPDFLTAQRAFFIGGTFRNINKALAKHRGEGIKEEELHLCPPEEFAEYLDMLCGLDNKGWEEQSSSLQMRKDFIPAANILLSTLLKSMKDLKDMGLVKTKTRDGIFAMMHWEHKMNPKCLLQPSETSTSARAIMARMQ